MKNDLFTLIKSLSPSEKRYYKVQNTHNIDKAYMRLFTWMDGLEAYDDSLAKKEFEGEVFMKQFGVIKNYLKESLLDTLRSFHKNRSPLIQLRNRIDYIELLFQRGHVQQAQKEARSAFKVAEEAGYIGLQIECLKWEIRLSRLQGKGIERIGRLREQLMELARQEIREAEVSALFDEVFDLTLQRGQSNISDASDRIRELENTALEFRDCEPGIHTQMILQQILAYLALLKPDLRMMNDHYRLAIQLVEGSKPYQRFRPDLVLNFYTSYLESCFLNNIFDKTEEVTQRIEKLQTRNRAEKIRLEIITVSLRIQHFIQTENFPAAADLESVVSGLVDRYGNSIPSNNKITLIHNLSMSLFLAKRYSLCKKWLGYTLNQSPSSNRMDIWEFARLLFPLVLWEIRELGLLQYEIRNSERFFARRGKLTPLESAVLTFLKECIRTTTPKEEEDSRDLLQKTLADFPAEFRNHLGYEVVVKWV